MDTFVELADNEPSDCSQVVRGNSRKWGHFSGALCGTMSLFHSLRFKQLYSPAFSLPEQSPLELYFFSKP